MSAQTHASAVSVEDSFAVPATAEQLQQVALALESNGFAAEVVDTAEDARRRIRSLVPGGSSVLTAASETLRLSGIADDIDHSDAAVSIGARVHSMNRQTEGEAIRRLMASPDVVIGSVSAVTHDGSLVAVSASGSQLPAYAGGAGRLILVIGAQKVVADLAAAMRRIESYALPLETERTKRAYGVPSFIGKILIINRDYRPGRTTIILTKQAIGF
ncbi:MAG TPA: LUD domain-containing protein [Gemmatimonadaceae bacterium]|nr:LUD domain-containing protein [Gemmatimonadaceae bacterium]